MRIRTYWLPIVWLSLGLFILAFGCGPKAGKEPTPEPTGFAEVQEKKGEQRRERKAPLPLPAEDYFTHKVKWPGESLSIIAKWYIGQLQDWKLLAKHNPELNPNQIFVGDDIRIPKSRMQTHEPMPREFVEQFVSAPQQKEADKTEPKEAVQEEQASEEQPEQAEEKPTDSESSDDLELFGPKGLQSN